MHFTFLDEVERIA